MAARFWVGGSGTWDASTTTNWATSTGAAGGASAPTTADTATFDANSGAGTVTLSGSPACSDLIASATSITTFTGSGTLTCAGSFTLKAGMTISGWTGQVTFTSVATGKTITMAGNTPVMNFSFNGSGGGWQFQDNFIQASGHDIELVNGTVDTNGKTITSDSFIWNGASSTLNAWIFGASTINCVSFLDVGSNGHTTITPGTSQINLTGGGFNGGGLTWNNVSLTLNGSTVNIQGANTFNNLTITGNANKFTALMGLSSSSSQTCTGTFTATGNSAINRLRISGNNSNIGTNQTITAAVVSLTNVDFVDITGAGAATWSGTSIGDLGGNSGITFTTPVTRFWVGDGGNWYDTTHWSTLTGGASGASVPLAQDTAIFDANSFTLASQTVNMDGKVYSAMDWTGATNSPILDIPTGSSASREFYGAITLIGGMSVANTATVGWSFYGRGSYNCNFGGLTIFFGVTLLIDIVTGTLTLTGDLTMTNGGFFNTTLAFLSGTFSANGHNVTAPTFTIGAFSSIATNLRTLNMGSGTWTIFLSDYLFSGFFHTPAWYISQNTNTTINASTSTIVFTDTDFVHQGFNTASSAIRIFQGGGHIYNNVTMNALGQFQIQETGNTFNIFTMQNGVARKLTLPASGTTTITTLNLSGNNADNDFMRLVSSTVGTQTTISVASGTVVFDRVNIKDIAATGGATFEALPSSQDLGNNTGITFDPNGTKPNNLRPRPFAPGLAR